MTTAASCTLDALHRDGRRFDLQPFRAGAAGSAGLAGPGGRTSLARCGDCGVHHNGWHHPGCDLQRCPSCGHQLMSCDCLFDEDGPAPDGNGVLTERMRIGEHEVIIRRDDVPASDLTTVRGIPCTTALRTLIDIAPEVPTAHLQHLVTSSLERGLFTVAEAWQRVAQPDMAQRPGADMLRRALPAMPQSSS